MDESLRKSYKKYLLECLCRDIEDKIYNKVLSFKEYYKQKQKQKGK